MKSKYYYKIFLFLILLTIGIVAINNRTNTIKKDEIYDCRNYVSTLYHNMQLRFNIPMYIAILKAQDYSHCLNCVLIGDSVLKYSDWTFIEPQNDFMFKKGKPILPSGTISIISPKKFSRKLKSERFDNFEFMEIIRFKFKKDSTIVLEYYHPDLILNREEAITKRR